VLAVFALLFAFYSAMIVRGYEPFSPDSAASLAHKAWIERSTGHGRTPLWNPEIFLGMPSFGSYTYTPVGVLNWIAATLDLNRGAVYFLALALGASALFAFLRRAGGSAPACFAGAITFIFTPYLVGLVNAAHSTKLVALSLVPVVLWAVDGLARGGGWLWVGVTAWALAQLVWANHPQIAFYAALFLGPYFLVRAWKEGWLRDRARWGRIALALAVALLMIAHPLLDVMHYTHESTRGANSVLPGAQAMGTTSWEYATAWSFSPKELVSFVFPSFFGLEGRTYWGNLPFTQSTHAMGIVALAYGALGFFVLRGWQRAFWAIAALVCLVIGFGRNFPVFYWPLFHFFPFFDKFRVPSMIYSFLPLFVAVTIVPALDVVAAAGENAAAKRARSFFRVVAIAFGAAVLIGILGRVAGGGTLSGWFESAWERQAGGAPGDLVAERRMLFWNDILRSSLLALLAAVLALLRLRGRITGTGFWAGTLALFVVDLYSIDRSFYRPEPPRTSASASILPEDVLGIVRSGDAPVRVLPLTLENRGGNAALALASDTDWPLAGVQSVGGYHPAGLRRVKDFIQSGVWQNPALWRSLDVDYVSLQFPGARLSEDDRRVIAENFSMLSVERFAETPAGDLALFRHGDNLGRAFVVPDARVIVDPLARLEFLASPAFDPASIVAIERDVPSPADRNGGPATAKVTAYDDERVEISVAGGGGFLVLADAYYPDWKAELDGRPVEILAANHVLRAVAVPPGDHAVQFSFRDATYERGRILGLVGRLAGVLLVLVGLVEPIVRRRRS